MYEGSASLMSNVHCYWLLPLWCSRSHKTNKARLCSNMTGATTEPAELQVFIGTLCKWISAMLDC